MSVSRECLPGYPKLNFSTKGASAVSKFKIAWADINMFGLEIFAGQWIGGGGSGDETTFSGYPFLFAESMEVDPWFDEAVPDSSDPPAYAAGAMVTVNYKTKERDKIEGSGTFSHKIDVGGQILSIPSENLKWATTVSGSTAVNKEVQAGLLIPTMEHDIGYYNVSTPPWAAIRDCIGRVNSVEYPRSGTARRPTISGYTSRRYVRSTTISAAVGTLLMTGASLSYDNKSALTWTIGYKFSERAVEWNKFFRPPDYGFDTLLYGNGEPIYESADFNTLEP